MPKPQHSTEQPRVAKTVDSMHCDMSHACAETGLPPGTPLSYVDQEIWEWEGYRERLKKGAPIPPADIPGGGRYEGDGEPLASG